MRTSIGNGIGYDYGFTPTHFMMSILCLKWWTRDGGKDSKKDGDKDSKKGGDNNVSILRTFFTAVFCIPET
jgi:hypothetical protein